MAGRHRGVLTRRSLVMRRWRAALSVLVSAALICGYAAADAQDVLPGPLTLKATRARTASPARTMPAPPGGLGAAGVGGPVNQVEARQLVEKFADSPGLGQDYSLVIRQADGRPVIQESAQVARQPASTMKTLTAAAAASVLDMSSHLATDVRISDVAGDHARLVLEGHGDMLLGSGTNDSHHVNGRAGLATLAAMTTDALRRTGVSRVTVAYDDGLFNDAGQSEGLQENNPGGIYFQEPTALAVDQGRDWSGTQRGGDPDAGDVYLPRVPQPAAQAALIFAGALSGNGIGVDNPDRPDRAESGRGPVIASVRSARLSEIMALMLRTSDNTLAELFGRLTAMKMGKENRPEGAVRAVTETLNRLGVDTKGLVMADCSGLAPGSALSVNTLAQIQELALGARGIAPVAKGLSVVGLAGTAATRKVDDHADGLVRVKTGTLDQVTSMTGNVSRRSGGSLVFAVIVNNPRDMAAAKQAVDLFVTSLDRL
ncbi:D-alanyl-D-alanine carboxypeptidase/D-alanyl-D-alanine-endopeptidase [Bifidobacterium indicum]|uniref:D-alanyl-D-alanine carboxypeptidase/D-alanyl-D-alanine-endopeptidase n=2 Tax=Bifidobacterium indicum TaxID=1691 RepID=UPI0030DD0909